MHRHALPDFVGRSAVAVVGQRTRERFRKFRNEGLFVPFSVGKDTVVFPGFDGGAEWGGPAVDRQTGIIYVNANEVAWTGALTENTGEGSVRSIYLNQCGVCHGEKMEGSPPAIPSLVGAVDRNTPAEVSAVIKNGKGRMQGFPNLTDEQVFALVNYISTGESKELTWLVRGKDKITIEAGAPQTGFKKLEVGL